MPGTYKVSRTAVVDLLEIWNYIADDNIEQAETMSRRFFRQFEHLAANPTAGRIRTDLYIDVCSSVVGRYVIFYRTIDDGIDIVHVVHGSRDLAAFFR